MIKWKKMLAVRMIAPRKVEIINMAIFSLFLRKRSKMEEKMEEKNKGEKEKERRRRIRETWGES